MSLEGVIEIEAAIEQADSAIVAADHHFPPPARAASNRPVHLLRHSIGFPGIFLLEELEFPPLVHSRQGDRTNMVSLVGLSEH